ncbi:hypothetical protein [Streptomyces rochei]|uniref:hypothetical protein n=1 Tax=Streptomyces rochei TaxID=1928 RepID=UPI003691452A
MPLTRTRQTLKDVAAACLGWRHAYIDATEVAAALDAQTETAYRQATNSGLVIGQHDSALVMQPDVLDIRSRVLADVLRLENLLDGARTVEQWRAEGLPVRSAAGALAEVRREQLEDIDPSWCPAWPVEWQRAFHFVRLHLDAGLTRCRRRRVTSCVRAKISGGGCARSGSGGTS